MGTRHLVTVKNEGKFCVAQYGQWDGYPTGQGADLVNFLKDKDLVQKLRTNIAKVRLMEENDPFIEKYNSKIDEWGTNDKRTATQKKWFEDFACRDLGAKILNSIANSKRKDIPLVNSLSFANDDCFCEYSYLVDLDSNELKMYYGGGVTTHPDKPLATYSFDNLPSFEDLDKLEEGE